MPNRERIWPRGTMSHCNAIHLRKVCAVFRVWSAYRVGKRHSDSLYRAQQRINPGWVIEERQQRLWGKIGREGPQATGCGCRARRERRDRAETRQVATCCESWRFHEKSPGGGPGLDLLTRGERLFAVADLSCGDRIRTCDLEVMSLASYRTAPPRGMLWIVASPSRIPKGRHLIIVGDGNSELDGFARR